MHKTQLVPLEGRGPEMAAECPDATSCSHKLQHHFYGKPHWDRRKWNHVVAPSILELYPFEPLEFKTKGFCFKASLPSISSTLSQGSGQPWMRFHHSIGEWESRTGTGILRT